MRHLYCGLCCFSKRTKVIKRCSLPSPSVRQWSISGRGSGIFSVRGVETRKLWRKLVERYGLNVLEYYIRSIRTYIRLQMFYLITSDSHTIEAPELTNQGVLAQVPTNSIYVRAAPGLCIIIALPYRERPETSQLVSIVVLEQYSCGLSPVVIISARSTAISIVPCISCQQIAPCCHHALRWNPSGH